MTRHPAQDLNGPLGPTRLVLSVPSLRPSEVLLILGLLDQVVEQLWSAHGDAITAFMIEERRRNPPPPRVDDLPF